MKYLYLYHVVFIAAYVAAPQPWKHVVYVAYPLPLAALGVYVLFRIWSREIKYARIRRRMDRAADPYNHLTE